MRPISAFVLTAAVNHVVPGCNSQQHVDIVAAEEDNKKILIIDMTILFETQEQTFSEA